MCTNLRSLVGRWETDYSDSLIYEVAEAPRGFQVCVHDKLSGDEFHILRLRQKSAALVFELHCAWDEGRPRYTHSLTSISRCKVKHEITHTEYWRRISNKTHSDELLRSGKGSPQGSHTA